MAEALKTTATAEEIKEFRSAVAPVWCPGCGDFGALHALYTALVNLELQPKDVTVVSGIGCSGRTPIFTTCYGFHGVHGRVLPTATGVKLANPSLTVLAVGGDGDGLAIGGGHFPHAARRNIDITYIMLDNSTYGLTKGQPSPTTAPDFSMRGSPYGLVEENLNPIALALAYNVSFVARAFSGKPKQMVELFMRGIHHKGFAFIHVLSPCVVFNDTYPYYRQRIVDIPPEHNVHAREQALNLWQEPGKVYLGVFYEREIPGMIERVAGIRQKAQKDARGATIDALFHQFV